MFANKFGNSPDGLYTSMIGFFMKAGSAIGMWITGIVLSAIGFNAEAAEQAADTIANLKLAFGIIPAVILAVAVIAAIAYSLMKEKYALLLTGQRRRNMVWSIGLRGWRGCCKGMWAALGTLKIYYDWIE